MELLHEALSGEGDPEKCISAIASNFPEFIGNGSLLEFPIEVLVPIFSHKDLKYPDAEKTTNFFMQLFDRGEEFAQCFSDFVPFDELDLTSLFMLAKKLKTMKLELEAKRFGRIIRMRNTLNKLEERRKNSIEHLSMVAPNLQEMEKAIAKTQIDIKGTQAALDIAIEQIKRKTKQLQEAELKYIELQNAIIRQQI
jgi:hypothetical protein